MEPLHNVFVVAATIAFVLRSNYPCSLRYISVVDTPRGGAMGALAPILFKITNTSGPILYSFPSELNQMTPDAV